MIPRSNKPTRTKTLQVLIQNSISPVQTIVRIRNTLSEFYLPKKATPRMLMARMTTIMIELFVVKAKMSRSVNEAISHLPPHSGVDLLFRVPVLNDDNTRD